MRIELITDAVTRLGESPVWSVAEQRLYWVDSLGRRIFRATADGRELKAWDTPANIGSMVLAGDGRAVAALKTGVHLFDFASGAATRIANPEPNLPRNTLNDGKTDRQGRFLFGSMDLEEREPLGALYRLDADGSVHKLLDGVVCANGPCWSPGGSTFYFGDSGARVIWAFDYDQASGAIANRRVFTQLKADGPVTCDGSTVDAEGFLWNARVYGGLLVRHAPDGSVDRVVEMPVRDVTSVMFGGPDLNVLFVTSMGAVLRADLSEDGPARGRTFAVHGLGVRGVPEVAFAG